VLTADDFQYRDSTARASLDTAVIGAGWVTRRMIAAGEVLREPAVERPIAVSANAPVEIEWQADNVSLTMHGTSTRDASLGDRVTVRTAHGKRIEALVIAAGRVRIE
jgi:flagellar basal body P-ring formation protein FlgA